MRRGRGWVLGGLVLLGAAGGVAGQEARGQGQDAADVGRVAAMSVEPGHWVYPLLDAAWAAGAAPGWLPGREPSTATHVLAVLDSLTMAEERIWRRTGRAARERFLAELGVGETGARVNPWLEGSGGDGPRTELDVVTLGSDFAWRLGRGFALWGSTVLRLDGDDADLPLPRLGAAWEGDLWRVEATHDVLRYGPGARGGIVGGGEADLVLLEAGLARPVVLPGFLEALGRVQGGVSVSRFGADEYGPAVALVAGEVRLQPASWLLLQLHRSAVIAWEDDEGENPGVRDFAYWLIGKHTLFDDQRFAISAQLAARPLGLPVSPYVEWGIEDSAGMAEDPGLILGLLLPDLLVTDVPVSARYEYAAVGDDARVLWDFVCCFEPRNWYRHGLPPRTAYVDGEGELLGHPLGGYGHEHLLELEAPVLEAGLWLRGRLFARERERLGAATDNRSNLLYDVLPGESRGAALELRYYTGGLGFSLALEHEAGDQDWSRSQGSLRVTLLH